MAAWFEAIRTEPMGALRSLLPFVGAVAAGYGVPCSWVVKSAASRALLYLSGSAEHFGCSERTGASVLAQCIEALSPGKR